MEPTIAEIILQEKHVNQTNPASAKTSKQPAIQIIPGRKLKPVILSHHMLYGRGSPTIKGGKGYAWVVVGCKDPQGFFKIE